MDYSHIVKKKVSKNSAYTFGTMIYELERDPDNIIIIKDAEEPA